MSKWKRGLKFFNYTKKDPQFSQPKGLRVFISSGWATLTEMNELGVGYLKIDNGGGQLVRNWEHFFNMVEVIETDIEDVT